MTTTPVEQQARTARLARFARLSTFAYFVLNGFVLGVWIVHIPVVTDRADLAQSTLGWLLLALGIGAIAGMQTGGRVVDRFGTARVLPVAGSLMSLTVIGPAVPTDVVVLGAALVLLGFCNGLIDVAMNAHAVEVERVYDRPIMGAFHALFSFGGLLAALVGGSLIGADVAFAATATGTAVLGVAVALGARRWLLAAPPPSPAAAPGTDGTAPVASSGWTPVVVGLAGLAFVLMLAEGVANDWSTVHLRDSLGTDEATAAWAFGAFSAAMTVGRLVTDPVVHRLGRPRFVRAGALVAAAGLATASLAPDVPLALVGWTVFGIGLSGLVPQFFSAAGNLTADASGRSIARVVGSGYVGLLAGPAVIGVLTDHVDLTTAFWLPVAGCLLAAVVAPRLLRPAPSAAGA